MAAYGDTDGSDLNFRDVSSNGKRALITGITGQDGSYLAELLLSKGYEVFGLVRRVSVSTTARIDHLLAADDPSAPRLNLISGDLCDMPSLVRAVQQSAPDELYNLAAQSHVHVSFDSPEVTHEVNGAGTVRLLEALRELHPGCRFYQASSSELYGNAPTTPQNEDTPFAPRSPYAAAKAYAYHMTKNYRDGYGLFAVNGILFNHESPRRGETFVTRKVTLAAASIAAGLQQHVSLGNLDAKRDWGYAGEYVEAMWLMLQGKRPTDYVVATGETHSVRALCERAFAQVGLPLSWEGSEANEVGLSPQGEVLVKVDPHYYRKTEVNVLCGDASRIRNDLNWTPKLGFNGLIDLMVEADQKVVGNICSKR